MAVPRLTPEAMWLLSGTVGSRMTIDLGWLLVQATKGFFLLS